MSDARHVLKGQFPAFQTEPPEDAVQWDNGKIGLRRTIQRLLGDMPPVFTPHASVLERREKSEYTVERFTFDNGAGDAVYGLTLLPARQAKPGPAILYHHWHAEQYELGKDEILTRVHPELGFATGEQLVREGYVVLCIDAYGFGERRFQGPAGRREQGADVEAALFKTFLWEGRTLWGMMVRDDMLAMDYLASRPEVDPSRIAAMGVSMGSTRTWWLAALDERIKAAVCVACLTRYQDLIAHGSVNAHGIYYYVPNMLKEGIDAESVVGLIAPRPLLTLTGDQDEGSPADGVRTINAFQEHLYRCYNRPENFRGLLYPGVGHAYTAEMWRETLLWLRAHL
ncbi:MAG: dienelactone hydrolase family protein [Phycisphaerales bacterium]